MTPKEFEAKVEKELENLNRKQVVQFAWRSAMRALPFLGSHGNFNFWEEDRQKHLFSIFYALDVNADAFAAAAAAADATFAARAAAATAADAFADAAARAAADARAAAAADAFADARAAAARAAADARTATFAARAAKWNIDLRPLILGDIATIKQGKIAEDTSTEVYGNVWENFQTALKNEGCEYWATLYQKIFENGFVLDKEALEQRINNVPESILALGAAEVGRYLEGLEKGATRLNEARIIILGDKGAGKTCLARKLQDPDAPMTTIDESTAGVDTTLWELEQDDMNVRIWDFAGHTVTHAVHQFFLSERCLYIMVYDGRTEERNRLEYWLNHMENYGGDSKAMIFVNIRDKHKPQIPINTLNEKYSIEGLYEFSIRDDREKLEQFRETVTRHITGNPSWNKQEIPESNYHVKEALEEIFAKCEKGKGKDHITKEAFSGIAKKYGAENTDELLTQLHALGISLWYKDMPDFNILVLNPEWISRGVYQIINWASNLKKHAISLDDLQTVFRENIQRYPVDNHKFLFELMKHYELAYETEKGNELIIPHLLNEDQPESKKLPIFHVGESLMLRYKAEIPLPPNTISRFIVRHNEEIKKDRDYLVWRYGVVLENEKGCIALVREEDRTISVSVKGHDKTEYISRLRGTLNDIFESYKSEKPDLEYRVERFGKIPNEVEEKEPLWLSERRIKNLNRQKRSYYDDETEQEISMAQVVNTYNITGDTVLLGGKGHHLVKNTFNFQNCNIDLQGHLNDLAGLLSDNGKKEEAEEFEGVASALEKVEQCKTPEDVKKSGIKGRLQRLMQELEDKNSKLHKTVKTVKNGVSVAQDVAKRYNDIAQWVGWPQVPTPFLK